MESDRSAKLFKLMVVGVRFTEKERALYEKLLDMACKNKRSLCGQVKWMIENSDYVKPNSPVITYADFVPSTCTSTLVGV